MLFFVYVTILKCAFDCLIRSITAPNSLSTRHTHICSQALESLEFSNSVVCVYVCGGLFLTYLVLA